MSDGQKRNLVYDVKKRQANMDNHSYDANTPTYNKYANLNNNSTVNIHNISLEVKNRIKNEMHIKSNFMNWFNNK